MSDGLAGYSKTSTSYDELVAGATITRSGVILTGQGVLLRGTILGQDPATGKWSQARRPSNGILVHNVDTTAGDKVGDVHVQGKYKDNVVIFPPAAVVAEVRAELHDQGVYLLDVQE